MTKWPCNRTFWISILITIIYRESINNSFIPLFERKWIGQCKSLAIESSLLVTKPWPGFTECILEKGKCPQRISDYRIRRETLTNREQFFFAQVSTRSVPKNVRRISNTCSIDQLINERMVIFRKNCWKESNHR